MRKQKSIRSVAEAVANTFANDWKDNPSYFPKGKDSVPALAGRIAIIQLPLSSKYKYDEEDKRLCGEIAERTCKDLLDKGE